ncbi:MAG: guanylate kinase [Candidatus Ancillula sp.]|jgi:guanylate kinase|nr:guanylate kinase [Candidatus Ancillula sp.]
MQDLNLTVLAGPTAVGKGTISRKLIEKYPNVYLSISATTRPARENELPDVHYHFLSRDEFEHRINQGDFLEWAVVHGLNMYGTLKEPILEANAASRPALLEIDLQGARAVKKLVPNANFVFLAPPSFEELITRLGIRGTESRDEREKRLETAREELSAKDEFDHIIVNDSIDVAVEELAKIMNLK